MSEIDIIAKLKYKWQTCWPEKSSSSKLDLVFDRLIAAYSHIDRYYHNLHHIDDVLTTLDRFVLSEPMAVYLAAWFHDFIYDPRSGDNESASAKAARELLVDLEVERATIDRVAELILATQGHQIDRADRDRSIFLDADLAILGAEVVTYQSYARSIRQEYQWVADAAYQAGRSRVLASFLQRDRLYYSDLLFTELETKARSNINQELHELQRPTLG